MLTSVQPVLLLTRWMGKRAPLLQQSEGQMCMQLQIGHSSSRKVQRGMAILSALSLHSMQMSSSLASLCR